MADLYPLLLLPDFHERVWGTHDLSAFYPSHKIGKEPIGEVWLTGEDCRIANGPLAGRTLRELADQLDSNLNGIAAKIRNRFLLLMKIIFPKDKLSVQVYPDDNAAQKVGGLAVDKVGDVKAAAIAALPQQGVLYHGLEVMGGGSILAGLVLGAIGVFVIERDFVTASAFAFSGAVLTYFGFMHGEAVGIGSGLGVTPAVALAYAVVAAGFLAVARVGASTESIAHSQTPLAAPAE